MRLSRDTDPLPSIDQLMGVQPPVNRLRLLRAAWSAHPAPIWGYLETAFWLVILWSMVDHLLLPEGTVASFIWALTIGFHELGHVLCAPFGTLLMFLGGSIWQVLVWLLIGGWEWYGWRRLSLPLLCFAVAGHSLINAAVYIGDAQARSLPLLFGMSADHHDWWNILMRLGLLPYDGLFASAARVVGISIVITAAAAGAYYAWVRPRMGIGRHARALR